MNREIGSEFFDVPVAYSKTGIFPDSTQWFVSGRSALKAIIQELKNCHTVSMPSWCCDSMIKPFVDAGMEISFYPVYWGGDRLVQELWLDSDVLFLMDYFGYSSPQPDLSGYKGKILRDVTHSVFSSAYSDSDYYFGSLRKWCGLWTGGYAFTRDNHKIPVKNRYNENYLYLREKAMSQKAEYINGQRRDKNYLNLFDEAEKMLENFGVDSAADRDIKLSQLLDVESIKHKRRINAEILRAAFPDWLLFPELKESDCPMFVPVLVPDNKRNKLRKQMIQKEIYCPVHWPVSKFHRLHERTAYIYEHELSLVCDQRYKKEDMYRLVDIIKTIIKEL